MRCKGIHHGKWTVQKMRWATGNETPRGETRIARDALRDTDSSPRESATLDTKKHTSWAHAGRGSKRAPCLQRSRRSEYHSSLYLVGVGEGYIYSYVESQNIISGVYTRERLVTIAHGNTKLGGKSLEAVYAVQRSSFGWRQGDAKRFEQRSLRTPPITQPGRIHNSGSQHTSTGINPCIQRGRRTHHHLKTTSHDASSQENTINTADRALSPTHSLTLTPTTTPTAATTIRTVAAIQHSSRTAPRHNA